MPLFLTVHRYLLGLALSAACAGAAAQPAEPLADYSLEQLSDIVVTSVARQETSLASAPVSIHRITRRMIRRAGATTLPEALRLAPLLLVARTSPADYAIASRGFASTVENKLLVMIDGRVVYSPLFSGVFWDVQDVLLEDVERIEVISGPGSTIWGANAVNGVINVITRSAADTRGVFAAAGAGGDERHGAVRFGAGLPGGGSYRLYAKYAGHDDFRNEAGQAVRGRWQRRQAGFRTDFTAGEYAVRVSGDGYSGRNAEPGQGDVALAGSNVVASASRTLEDGSSLRLQAWIDYVRRVEPAGFAERLHTADLEAQHDLQLGGTHNISWGAGIRQARDRVLNGGRMQFFPANATLRWGSLFAQDRILLSSDLQLTLGTRFEKSTYSQLEWLPTARLAYHTGPSGLLWLGLARTVRAPSRANRDLHVLRAQPGGTPYLLEGNTSFGSEIARVAELGYRGESGTLAYSLVGYHARYDDLRAVEPRPGASSVITNNGQGKTRGLELLVRWGVTPAWQLSGGAVLQRVDTWVKSGSRANPHLAGVSANDPDSYWRLHSAHDLGHGIEFDVELRRVARLPEPAVPSYHELDVRLAWNAGSGLEASVTGRNLLHSEHPEFGPAATRQLVGRSVLFNLSWRY